MECTHSSDSRVQQTHDIDTLCIPITLFIIPHFFIILLFRLWIFVYRHTVLGQLRLRLSRDLAGDPKQYIHIKYNRKAHLAGDPKRKG